MSNEQQVQRIAESLSPRRFFFSNEVMRNVAGWYYIAREGTFGPFFSKEDAQYSLAELIYRNPQRRRIVYRRSVQSSPDSHPIMH